MVMIHSVEIFVLVLLFSYLALSLVVKIIHLITKNKSKSYRLAVIIFSFLLALMATYMNLGR